MPITMTVEGAESLVKRLDKMTAALRGQTIERALVAGALIIQNDAKQRAPFRTGTLRRSIHIGGHSDLASDFLNEGKGELPGATHRANEVSVLVGTNVEYARRIEYGFHGADVLGRNYEQEAQPYLRPALDENRDAVAREVGEALWELIEANG